jgi:septum site-determining protein MinC
LEEEDSPLVGRSSSAVEIKGYGNDVNIILNDKAAFPDVEAELIRKLEDSDQFFSGIGVVLDVGDRVLGPAQCETLKGILSDRFNLAVSAVRSRSDETQEVIGKIGWKIMLPSSEAKDESRQQKSKIRIPNGRENDTILIKRTVRSGQREWHRGNIVIIGDVNPGAEVVATGDVVIVGRLRGIAHAGAEGNTSAVIIAISLRPIQLRIAEYIGRSPDLDPEMDNTPEMAQVENGSIIIRKLK